MTIAFLIGIKIYQRSFIIVLQLKLKKVKILEIKHQEMNTTLNNNQIIVKRIADVVDSKIIWLLINFFFNNK